MSSSCHQEFKNAIKNEKCNFFSGSLSGTGTPYIQRISNSWCCRQPGWLRNFLTFGQLHNMLKTCLQLSQLSQEMRRLTASDPTFCIWFEKNPAKTWHIIDTRIYPILWLTVDSQKENYGMHPQCLSKFSLGYMAMYKFCGLPVRCCTWPLWLLWEQMRKKEHPHKEPKWPDIVKN